MAQYTRLSAQDASFLAKDSEATPMVIGALAIYDGKTIRLSDGSLDFERIRSHIAFVLHRTPSLTRQLSHVPLFGHPVWVDAPEIDLEHHLNRVAIPAPGHVRNLTDLVGRLYARPLPRDRPLWDIWVIEGLRDQRFALLTRMHHSLVDGGAGLEVLAAFHSLTPEVRADAEEPKPWRGGLAPSPEKLLFGEIAHRVRGVGGILGGMLRTLAQPGRALDRGMRLAEGLVSLVEHPAKPSPLNGRVSVGRRVSWLTTPLDDLLGLKRRLGGTLNDAVLAVTAGALRKVLADDGRRVDELTLRVSCPSNSRPAHQRGARGNYTASFIVDLPIYLANPQERYDAIVEVTQRAKASRQADAVQFVLDLADQTVPEIAGAVMGLASRFQNLVVSNVAGPSVPIYLAGCRAQELCVFTILLQNTALAMTLFSYDGRMSWSLSADWQLMPNLVPLERAIREEIALLSSIEPRYPLVQ